MLFIWLLSAVLAAPAHAVLDAGAAVAPAAERRPKDVSVHGDRRIDDFFWLREKESPAVRAHLEAENAYAAAVMAPTLPLQEKLYREMLARIRETDVGVPAAKRGYFYYARTEKGRQYPIHCRKKGSLDAPEQVLLDLNAMAQGGRYIALGWREASDSGRLLAYTLDRSGHHDYVLHVKDLSADRELKVDVGAVAWYAWSASDDVLFYAVEEQPSKRSFQLWRYRLSTREKTLVYEEKDPTFALRLGRTRDGRYLLATSESKKAAEVRFLRADRPEGAWTLVAPREAEHKYFLEHRDGRFYILTNKGALNNRVVSAPVANPGPAHWTEFVAHRPAVKLVGFEPFARHAVLYERENGLPQLRVLDFATGRRDLIPMPEPVYEVHPEINDEFETSVFRFRYESMVSPSSVYAYDMSARTRTLLKQDEVPGGFDRARYASERIFATASDGTRIPISIVRRTGLPPGPRPLLLYGYGSYGGTVSAQFSAERLSLLDRGVVYAQAHVRGGGEFGEPWREAGRMARKMTTFTDFVSCAEHLVREGVAAPDRMAISGVSAGGLLVGAVLNLRPGLFRAALLDVPFVDMLNTMLDPSIPETTAEYLEWGNPEVRTEYAWMRAYSPYDNLSAAGYPAMLVNVSLNDSQVPYWEGAKYVAKLRGLRTDSRPLLLHADFDAGHGGASGRYDALRKVARDFAFILSELGVE